MAYGPNRWGKRPSSTAIKAGGIEMFYRHPKLAGHVADGLKIDEINVSKACKLNDTFLDAAPAMDSAFQEILVDGSVITITNNLLAGVLTLQVLEQGGFIGRGDFITALQFVQSSGDAIGGTFTVIRNFNGTKRVRVYYGVFVKNVPHEKVAGNAVVPYPVQLSYAGWFDGVGENSAEVKEYLWAVGNDRGVSGNYKVMALNKGDNTSPGTSVETYDLHYDKTGGVNDDLTQMDNVPNDISLNTAAIEDYYPAPDSLTVTPNPGTP